MNVLTHELLKGALVFDVEICAFRWRIDRNGVVKAGDVAGSIENTGYMRVCVFGKRYQVNRLVWFYFHGKWPSGKVDHIDGDILNNHLKNLRDVSQKVNTENMRRAMKNNRTGLLGVCKRKNRFQARIRVDGKLIALGSFMTGEEAHQAYLSAKRVYHKGCTL